MQRWVHPQKHVKHVEIFVDSSYGRISLWTGLFISIEYLLTHASNFAQLPLNSNSKQHANLRQDPDWQDYHPRGGAL